MCLRPNQRQTKTREIYLFMTVHNIHTQNGARGPPQTPPKPSSLEFTGLHWIKRNCICFNHSCYVIVNAIILQGFCRTYLFNTRFQSGLDAPQLLFQVPLQLFDCRQTLVEPLVSDAFTWNESFAHILMATTPKDPCQHPCHSLGHAIPLAYAKACHGICHGMR